MDLIMQDSRAIGRETFWHGKNIVDDLYAVEALERMGYFEVKMVDLPALCPFTGKEIFHDNHLLVRSPMPHPDPRKNEDRGVVLGRPVNSRFQIIQPMEAAEDVEECIRDASGGKLFVDAMGFLGNGDRMWITIRQPDYDVTVPGSGAKVPHRNYILYWNSLSPDVACRVLFTNICVVCWNTAQMALENNEMDISVHHTEGARERLRTVLREVWYRGELSMVESQRVAAALCKKQITDDQAHGIINNIFPMPNPPKASLKAKSSYETRDANYRRLADICKQKRNTTWALYQGEGETNKLPGVGGTAFGLYNAFTDLASHMKGDGDQALREFVEGDRGRFTRNALTALMQV